MAEGEKLQDWKVKKRGEKSQLLSDLINARVGEGLFYQIVLFRAAEVVCFIRLLIFSPRR